jgi:exodeoxyribonuclease VII small subunit
MTEFTSFKDGFEALKRNAESLRAQSEPDIDQLLPIVEESIKAYGVCKERINAVEIALKEALGESTDNDSARSDPVDTPR